MTDPVDLPVGQTVDLKRPQASRRTGPVGTPAAVTVSAVSRHHHQLVLSVTQAAVVHTVLRFGQASSSQLRLLHYTGGPRGTRTRCARHLKALTERGLIRRVSFRLSGFGMGSGEYIYCPPESTARSPNLHTLDITELWVQIKQAVGNAQFDPEPWAHTTYGGHKVTPDAYVRLAGSHYWCEIDRASEAPSVISAKMNRYVTAFRSLDGGSFPQVLWIAHTPERVRTLEREAKKKGEPGLFVCVVFDDAVGVMTGAKL